MSIERDQPGRALFWMLLSGLGFACMALFVKRLSGEIPPFEQVFCRAAINLALVSGMIAIKGKSVREGNLALLAGRGLAGFIGSSCLVFAVFRLPLSISMMLGWCSPLFVFIFSALFTREKPGRSSWLFVLMAFCGLALLLQVGHSVGSVNLAGAAIGLLGAIAGALAYLAVRRASMGSDVEIIVFYFSLVSTLLSAPLAIRSWVVPSGNQWMELIMMGLAGSVGQLTMTRAYRFASAPVVSTMNLFNAVYSALFGALFFHESLAIDQWIGMFVLALGVNGVIWWPQVRKAAQLR